MKIEYEIPESNKPPGERQGESKSRFVSRTLLSIYKDMVSIGFVESFFD